MGWVWRGLRGAHSSGRALKIRPGVTVAAGRAGDGGEASRAISPENTSLTANTSLAMTDLRGARSSGRALSGQGRLLGGLATAGRGRR
jgi:hypothetical protein